MATQNPIDQEGTYPLPEAQVDRFMLKLRIDYPTKEEEKKIMQRMASVNNHFQINPLVHPDDILKARESMELMYIDENLQDYIVNIVMATRNPETFNLPSLKSMIQYGASPRASIYLNRAAKAYAFMQNRGYVIPQDIKTIGTDVLRHRIILTYEAEAENVIPEEIIQKIFDTIEVP